MLEQELTLEQKRLLSLLDYLEALEKLHRQPVFQISEHGGFAAYQKEILGLPSVELNELDETGQVWLSIERLRPQRPPRLPEELTVWVSIKDDPASPPKCRPVIKLNPENELRIEDHSDIAAAFDAYVEQSWRPWSETELPRRRTITLYDKLFNLKQAIESEGTESPTELAWGVGIVVWNRERKIQYPLLTQLVEIDHIGADMAIRIRPREVEPRLELDPYHELENLGAPILEKRARAILQQAEATMSPFDPASFEEILASAAATLDPQGKYWPRECEQSDAALPSASAELRVTDSWVLFARRKSTSFLVEDVRRLKEAVKSQSVFDGGPKVLVEDPTGPAVERRQFSYRGVSSPGISSEGGLEIRNLCFPRPFNKEQVAIVEKLDQADGVVVQGPPGTGKTHTISNIICHYLALGKRVLVTSKGESALAVLRDQIPSAVRPLTISLLTNEREGLKQLEYSVAKIATDISHLNKAEVREEIGRTETIIHKLHQKLADLDRRLADWALRNLSATPENLGGLMPEELAHRVVAEHEYHSWFPDDLSGDAEFDPQFSEIDVDQLRRARQSLGRDLQYLSLILPSPTELVDGPTLAVVHRDLQTLGQIADQMGEEEVPPIRASTTEMLLKAEQLLDYIQEAMRLNAACQADWLKQLRREFRCAVGGTPVPHVTKLLGLLTELAALEGTRVEFVATAVELPDDAESDDELLSCAKRASQGARPFGLIAIGKGELKRRFSSIRVNGSSPRDGTHWWQVVQYLELLRGARSITIRWNAFRAEFDGPVISETGTVSIKSLSRVAEQIREAQCLAERFDPAIPALVEELFPGVFKSAVITSDEREMNRLANALRLHLSRNRLSAAQRTLDAQKRRIKVCSGELFDAMRAFLDSPGCVDVSEQSVQERWSSFIEELTRLRTQEPHFQTVLRASSLIKQSGGGAWAQRLQQRPATEEDDIEIPSHWRESWQWSRRKGYLRDLDGRMEIARLNGERRRAEHDLARVTEHVVEQLTWLKLREALDQDRSLMAALQQYMAAIRSIGAGTGVRAIRFRRDARRAMEKANQAIRCWIMPHWRISETLPSELASFDLVILDEASQSDLWALPALLRAKKILVVGDNKQVSPSVIGLKEADIRNLHRKFLSTLPYGDVMTPEKSIYDLASVLFASDLVRLREHFRCVESIIQFSNRLCYNNEIRCLRVPTATERLSPTLIDVFVRGGYRHAGSQKINLPEAEAIVAEIKRIVTDPAFEKRTLGVVSLLGSEQARVILEMLVSEIGEEKVLKHQIRCGDAMTFQGREADIMFITMVSDQHTLRAATGEMYEQRFNVAASRAKDQMYLFRSFERSDLSDSDLRARLLDHFKRPLQQDSIHVKALRELCESDFERSVFDALTEKDYRVLPQVRVGGHRIDMVVEGNESRRLAIECDGDRFHTPENWLADIARQRVLERAGWRFWRCWGSSFTRDRDGCLRDLYAALHERGIAPIGAAEIDFIGITEYREVGVPEVELKLEQEEEVRPQPAPQTAPVSSEGTRSEETNGASQSAQPGDATGEPLTVGIGDSVEFIFVDEPADENWAMIITGESNPKLGLISVHTPVAQALLGSAVGAEVLAPLPVGLRKLKVLAIQKHSVAHPADYAQEDNDVLIHVPVQPPPRPSNHPRREGFRTIHVKVTQGMINQNLLTLTEYVNRGVVRIGEEFMVESDPPGEFFKTDVVQHGNKLRERGAIARFYRMAGVRAGDSVVLTEIAPGRWKLARVAGQRDLDARDGPLF